DPQMPTRSRFANARRRAQDVQVPVVRGYGIFSIGQQQEKVAPGQFRLTNTSWYALAIAVYGDNRGVKPSAEVGIFNAHTNESRVCRDYRFCKMKMPDAAQSFLKGEL